MTFVCDFFLEKSDQLLWGDFEKLFPENSPVKQAVNHFIYEYGYRSEIELEVSQPRWSENLEEILKFLQICLCAHSSTRVNKKELIQRRLEAEKIVLAAQNIFTRPLFSWALGKSGKFSKINEGKIFFVGSNR